MIEWRSAPWDEAVTGYPVWDIKHFVVEPTAEANLTMTQFEEVRSRNKVGLVSCRLHHSRLTESMFLEKRGFRFIEMLYQPELELSSDCAFLPAAGDDLLVRRATEDDLPKISDIAGCAFTNERFHVDPRLAREVANTRYRNWVKSSFSHPTQRLYGLWDQDQLVAFFVTELLPSGVCYWHLNAVAPAAQGKGYGLRAWRTMIRTAVQENASRIQTSIVARNNRVLNLYARLGFRFPPPLMTFHWVDETNL